MEGKRGRNPISKEAKQLSDNRQFLRVKIANLVSRKCSIDNICCICGKKGNILHNPEDPYNIAFICLDCRKTPKNLEIAEKHRFNLLDNLKETKTRTPDISDKQVIKIIDNYMKLKQFKSIGDYCNEIGVSRYQFNKLVDRYEKLKPDRPIRQNIKGKSNSVQIQKVRQLKEI